VTGPGLAGNAAAAEANCSNPWSSAAVAATPALAPVPSTFGQTYLSADVLSLTRTASTPQQQLQQPYQLLLVSHQQAPAGVAATTGRLDRQPAAAAAAALSSYEEDAIDEDELCVVCWVGQRSVALVHGEDAHLVSSSNTTSSSSSNEDQTSYINSFLGLFCRSTLASERYIWL
jgi:hypothetical protein